MPKRCLTVITCLLSMACVAAWAYGGDNVAPGEPVIEEPTFLCLGFEWPLSGADNGSTGLHLANVTDGYSGNTPDLGAYELGQGLPHYGPRPE